MSKNIVVFIDGTGCDGQRDKNTTNVWELHKASLGQEHLNLYLPGVGSGMWDIFGGLVGFGTKERLEEAYNFLVKNHDDGDHIFLFGFSRGALAVRLFAGFLGYVGTLFGSRENRHYLPRVYQIYEASVLLNAADQFRSYMRHFGETTPLPIHFLGVWDTVVEYWSPGGVPDIEKLPNHISHARHALALHERRGEMEPTLWRSWDSSRSLVQQVWFPGCHSDVGGGYPESKLAEAPLSWMRDEASACGLHVASIARSGAERILHQERTTDALIGAAAKWTNGEGPRRALSTFASLDPKTDAQLIESLFVHQVACDELLDPIRNVKFLHYLPDFLDHSNAKDNGLRELKEIDQMTLQMFLDLRALGKKPIK